MSSSSSSSSDESTAAVSSSKSASASKSRADTRHSDEESAVNSSAPDESTLTVWKDNHVSDSLLRKLNIGAMILHFSQAVLMIIASQVVDNIREFQKEITTAFLEFDPVERKLVNKVKGIGADFNPAVAAAIFMFMSAIAHLIVVVFWKFYLSDLAKSRNQMRWYEYALSSSVMIIAIAVLFGCYDLATLILMFGCNAAMNFFGLLMEKANGPDREKTDWTAYNFGWLIGIAPWIVVFMYFLGGGNYEDIPGFVYGILGAYLFFFMSFAFNMLMQYKRSWRWANYRFGELTYIILSLVSKSLLAWLVFGGTFQPN